MKTARRNLPNFKSSSGLTVAELLIAMSLFGVITMASVAFFMFMKERSVITEQRLTTAAGQFSGSYFLYADIEKASPSYNNLINQADDNANNFFDYLPDENCIPQPTPNSSVGFAYCKREITLQLPRKTGPGVEGQLGQRTRPVIMMLTDDRAGSPLAFNPVEPYTFNGANLTFSTANLTAALAAPPYTNRSCGSDFNCANCPLSQYPCSNLWQNSRILEFYMPAYLRYVVRGSMVPTLANLGSCSGAACGVAIQNSEPKQPTYFITNRSGTPSALTLNSAGADVSFASPPTNSLPTALGSLNQFFLTLPPMGGGGNICFVRAVQVIRYFQEQVYHSQRWTFQLSREVYDGANWAGKQVVSTNIQQAKFTRDTITLPSLSIQLKDDPATVYGAGTGGI